MSQRIRTLTILICMICLTVSCAAPPLPLPTPSPAPSVQDLAWLWLPANGLSDTELLLAWRRGDPWRIISGDLVAVTKSGQLRPLGRGVTDIIERPGGSPLATLPISPTNQLALIDPASGAVVGDRQIERGGVISPAGTRFAARVDIPSPPDQYLDVTQITDITTGITSTIDIFDNYNLRYTDVLLGWGPHFIYGQTYEHTRVYSLWWIDPDSPSPKRQSFPYGVDTFTDELVFNAQTDTFVYTWQPDMHLALVTTTLMLYDTRTDETRQIGAGDPWPQAQGMQFTDLSLSPDGRYFACLQRDKDDRPPHELRLYDLSQPGPPRILDPALIPWDIWEYGERQYIGEIYAWSPDSAYLLVRTLPQPDEPGAPQDALIFRTGDGALVERVDLPADTGALHLTNDLRLLMISYQGEAAHLATYDVRTHTAGQSIPLGVQTPIIVYVPES
ncbi:hypothetical protein EKD04_010550 [Chloroflexales bacterium ZM16-3]|nr:hypothetical protein [Chloroflexales bacterium ZM16-3]